MRVGSYTLHLYCDNPDNHKENSEKPPFEFVGVSETHAILMARRAGWRRVKGKGICPKCSGKGRS